MKLAMSVCMAALFATQDCNAIIIIPIPNLGFPPPLAKLRDALEKSTDTKALATVGEDKVFGSRQWTWGYSSGKLTQADANDRALRMCEANLVVQKNQAAGGQPLYDFGSKRCEIYKFANVTLNLPEPALPPPPVAPATVSSSGTPGGAPVIPEPVQMTPAAAQPRAPVAAPGPPAATASVAMPVASEPTVAPPSTAPAPSKGAGDIVQKMKDLDALYRQNLITQEEYERKKKQLLDTL